MINQTLQALVKHADTSATNFNYLPVLFAANKKLWNGEGESHLIEGYGISAAGKVGSRHIVAVDIFDLKIRQPFYKSTGINSGMKDAWLPFNGFLVPLSKDAPEMEENVRYLNFKTQYNSYGWLIKQYICTETLKPRQIHDDWSRPGQERHVKISKILTDNEKTFLTK